MVKTEVTYAKKEVNLKYSRLMVFREHTEGEIIIWATGENQAGIVGIALVHNDPLRKLRISDSWTTDFKPFTGTLELKNK